MSPDPKHPTRKDIFRQEIDKMLANGPYKDNPNLHRLYCIGLLKELLLYSGVDMFEVRDRIKFLAERDNSNK